MDYLSYPKIQASTQNNSPMELNVDFTLDELQQAIRSVKHNTSPGADGITYEIIKLFTIKALLHFLYLINKFWKQQLLPSTWKTTIILPLLKQGKDPHNTTSYRPIALTSCMGKITERIVKTRMVWFCEKHKLLKNINLSLGNIDQSVII